MPTCSHCQTSFKHLPGDREFYQTHEFPLPEMCPDCRHQLRISFRNERVLYRRPCAHCGSSMVTIFSGDRPFPVYCPECWWGDKWDELKYGREFDFNRPFFEQLQELQNSVPRLSLNNAQHENSEFCSQCIRNKNSYFIFAGDDNEDCMYGYWTNRCTDTLDSSFLADCTLCYDVVDAENAYHCIYCQDLKNCSDCYFSYNLIGCKYCFGCAGLRNKEYYFYNQKLSKQEWEKNFAEINLGSHKEYQKRKKEFLEARLRVPHKYIHILNCENCTGDYVSNSKNCQHCYDIYEAEDCHYAYFLVHQHYNNRDVSFITESRNLYQIMSTTGEEQYFGTVTWYSSNVWYCDLIQSCHNMFACIGMRSKKFCIFNKKYPEKEFKELREKIILHMKKTGEWGQFFPKSFSPFAYNETVAQDYFPLTQTAAEKADWRWRDPDAKEFNPQTYKIPDDIKDLPASPTGGSPSPTNQPDPITEEILACSKCKKNYRLTAHELKFYRQQNLPIPRECPDCRHQKRLKMRNPRQLHSRTCQKCHVPITTTYAPDRPEKVYCEKCYLEAMD